LELPSRQLFFFTAHPANPKEFQTMSHRPETVSRGDPVLELLQVTVLDLNDPGAACADKMMVVIYPPPLGMNKLVPFDAIAEIKPLDQSHLLQQVHTAINRRQVTYSRVKLLMNFLVGHRPPLAP
jgi:hypothetical protein